MKIKDLVPGEKYSIRARIGTRHPEHFMLTVVFEGMGTDNRAIVYEDFEVRRYHLVALSTLLPLQ